MVRKKLGLRRDDFFGVLENPGRRRLFRFRRRGAPVAECVPSITESHDMLDTEVDSKRSWLVSRRH